MNTYFLPRPSLYGAIVWQRRRSAAAITFSRIVLTYSMATSLVALVSCLMIAGAIELVVEHGPVLASCLLLVNVASATLVRIGPGGVRARRLFVPWARTHRAPLGGGFYDCESETDDWIENDSPDNRWNEYCALDENEQWVSVTIPGLSPEATARWLTAQLHRIQAQQLPTARVVASSADSVQRT